MFVKRRLTVHQLIEAARHAPTGGNVQNVEIIILEGEDQKKKLSESTVRWE